MQVVKLLLGKKADVNAASDDKRTPLMHAAMAGHVEVVKASADVSPTAPSHVLS